MSTLNGQTLFPANLLGRIAALEGLVEMLRSKVRHLESLPRSRALPADQPADLLTAAQVAQRLGCGLRTVYRMQAMGAIPKSVGFGRKFVRWSKTAIDQYLARLEQGEYPTYEH